MSRPALSSERPARVAGVDRGVRLDHVEDGRVADALDRAPEGAHDAGGEREVEAEGVADGVDLLAHLQPGARAEANRDELVARRDDPQHRDVLVAGEAHGLRVVADVAQRHLLRVGVLHHVEVRDHVPAVVPHEARAAARRHLEDVARPVVDPLDLGGDERHRARGILEELDVVALLGVESAGEVRRPLRRRDRRVGCGLRRLARGRERALQADRDEEPEHDAYGEASEEEEAWSESHVGSLGEELPLRDHNALAPGLGPPAHIRMTRHHESEGLRLRRRASRPQREACAGPRIPLPRLASPRRSLRRAGAERSRSRSSPSGSRASSRPSSWTSGSRARSRTSSSRPPATGTSRSRTSRRSSRPWCGATTRGSCASGRRTG